HPSSTGCRIETETREIAMNTKPTLSSPRVITTIVAAAMSSGIAIGLLATVIGLFSRDGAPFDQLVSAGRACAHCAFVSELQTCEHSFLAAARVPKVASR